MSIVLHDFDTTCFASRVLHFLSLKQGDFDLRLEQAIREALIEASQ